MIGSCRGKDDEMLLERLRIRARQLGFSKDRIEFFVNLQQDELLDKFARASFGIHTMENEHFGIAVVEMMAAGLVTIAHNSAGPLLDIIKTPGHPEETPRGFLANTKEDYVQILEMCLNPNRQAFLKAVTTKARQDMARFSDEAFQTTFVEIMKTELKL